jgi:hypothetical protein
MAALAKIGGGQGKENKPKGVSFWKGSGFRNVRFCPRAQRTQEATDCWSMEPLQKRQHGQAWCPMPVIPVMWGSTNMRIAARNVCS